MFFHVEIVLAIGKDVLVIYFYLWEILVPKRQLLTHVNKVCIALASKMRWIHLYSTSIEAMDAME